MTELYRADREAAELLAVAVRAERERSWGDAEGLLHRYAEVLLDHLSSFVDIDAGGGLIPDRPEDDSEADRLLQEPRDAGARVERIEESMTRLRLVGHPGTTEHLLSELVAYGIAQEDGATLALAQRLRLALDRFPVPVRLRVVTRVVAGCARGFAGRDRPAKVQALLRGTRQHLGSICIVSVLALRGGQASLVPALRRLRKRPRSLGD